MKEAIVSKGPKVKIVDSPIPKPNADQVLIKVVVSGSNPKDWKVPELRNITGNAGDDIAGVVQQVGEDVIEFKPGDRVAAFHNITQPHGSYAEYAIAAQHATFHIPRKTTFEEAAAIPLAAMTAAVGLYGHLGLPQPWTPPTEPTEPTPLIIHGASSAVGAYAVQFARKSNIHPLICVAGRSRPYVETLIDRSKGDLVIDYRDGDDAVVDGLRKASPGSKLLYAFDATSEHDSYITVSKVLSEGAKIAGVLPPTNYGLSPGVSHSVVHVGNIHTTQKDIGFIYLRYITRALQEGWFKAQPQEIVPGGLGGIQKALEDLKAGKAHAVKYVFRIADTEGVV